MRDLKKILKQVGLDNLESEVYLSLLELGTSAASLVARKAHIKRTNAYNILAKLEGKGLISELMKGNIKYYSATEPEKLLSIQEQKQKKIAESLENLKQILPELEALQNPMSMKPKVRFFQGEEGLSDLLDEIVSNQSFDSYFNPEVACKAFPDIMDKFLENGGKKKLKIRELVVDTPYTKQYISENKNPNHYYKILPQKYLFYTDYFVFDNQVAFISYKENNIAVVIESGDIARTQKAVFELMWTSVK